LTRNGRPDPGAEQEGAKFRDPADGQKNKLIECSIAWAIAIGVPVQEAAAALYCASARRGFWMPEGGRGHCWGRRVAFPQSAVFGRGATL